MYFSKFNLKKIAFSIVLAVGVGCCLAGGAACSNVGTVDKNELRKESKSSESLSVSSSEHRVSEQPVLTLATWNLENFFDTVDDDYNDDVLTESEYADKLSRVSSVLQQVGADVVGVEEIENSQVLSDLGRRSGYPYYVLIPGNDKVRGINVGVLSKVPVRNCVTHTQDSFIQPKGKRSAVFSRDCLEVHFNHKSNFTLLVNHFKSKRGGAATDAKRIAQAKRVKEIARSLSSYPTAICGDLNDTPEAKTLRPLLSCTFLTDVLGHLPETERRSFFNSRYQSALDYIIVNEKLKPAVVPNSAMVCADIPDIEKASDHRPVKVIFDFRKIK
ncbi:MAG: endonuclease/exonuclease/phosphatase family protein [Candidatus Bruticola sp.]